jgi:sigma-B regulation protein RsbU (phosphoserine phosphatase)
MLRAHGVLHEIAGRGASPARCLTDANARLCQANPLTLFVTLFFGILNTTTRQLRYANAGHELPLLWRADGSLTELPRPQGTLLGIIEEARFAEAEVQLAPGDRLFLYTDGITEAMNPEGGFFGMTRLRDSLRRAASQPVEPMMRQVMGDVQVFANGAPASDDLTCMVLGIG